MNIPRPSKFFTDEERHIIIQEYLKSGLSKGFIWGKYTGQPDHGGLLRWMRKLGYMSNQKNPSSYLASEIGPMPNKPNTQRESDDQNFEILQLKKRISELEKQLKEAELKAIAHATMVDIAEKEFNIPIRKKYNTKP